MGERGHDWRWAQPDPFAEPNVCARCGASANGFNNFGPCPAPAPRPTIQVMDGETGEDFASDFEARIYEKWYGDELSTEWCSAPTHAMDKEAGEDGCGGPVAYEDENGGWIVPRSQPSSRVFDCDQLNWYRSPTFSLLRPGVPWCPAPTPRTP